MNKDFLRFCRMRLSSVVSCINAWILSVFAGLLFFHSHDILRGVHAQSAAYSLCYVDANCAGTPWPVGTESTTQGCANLCDVLDPEFLYFNYDSSTGECVCFTNCGPIVPTSGYDNYRLSSRVGYCGTSSPSMPPTASRPPTMKPTALPTTAGPSATISPTPVPTTAVPTANPTAAPTYVPSAIPSAGPTFVPSAAPSIAPTAAPFTMAPTANLSIIPTSSPTSKAKVVANEVLATAIAVPIGAVALISLCCYWILIGGGAGGVGAALTYMNLKKSRATVYVANEVEFPKV